ncbi:unnamed protein product [Vicia faba]|uniref:Uncharacterized protein n=1 Tax=Vicia faba TaxID=3906 RepID=A0AAV0ZPR1_VICFA|nr:unnamed protein product [Vicia faba]
MDANDSHNHLKDIENDDLFSILDQIPQIGQTKVGELAKSFLWEPFFPVHLNDTILHALLLLSKHRLQVLPDAAPIGFVTQVSVELLTEEAYSNYFFNQANSSGLIMLQTRTYQIFDLKAKNILDVYLGAKLLQML